MADRSRIEWTDATWNPVTGCDKVSAGCDHCYAETIARRFAGSPAYPNGFAVTSRPDRLDQPLRWRRPRRIFVNSMSDLFHDEIPDEYIARVFVVMAGARRHTFQVLTKRHGRMRSLLRNPAFVEQVQEEFDLFEWSHTAPTWGHRWPLPNVWLGVSVEDQRWADIRIPALLDAPAAVRFLSCEPLLDRITLHRYLPNGWGESARHNPRPPMFPNPRPTVDWVIVGGESGRGARPMQPDWARSLRDQCRASSVAFYFKQWGEWAPVTDAGGEVVRRIGKKTAGRVLDGRTWDQCPAQLEGGAAS
jgi:protein gp37